MSNTSFDKTFQILSKSLEELQETELCERVAYDYIAETNKQRKSAGQVPLYIDENCSEAANNSFQCIGNIQTLLKSHNVYGSDFSHIFHEHNLSLTPSISQNKSIYEGFIQLFNTLDPSNKSRFLDPNYNSIGITVKRSFGCFKIMAIFFKKSIIINHMDFDITNGYRICGKMTDGYSSIFVVAVKDGKDSVKPGIAGPKRISLKADLKEFEVIIPRILLTSRSMSEKIVEVYTMKADPRSIGYSTGQDLSSIPPDAVLSYGMKFMGIWESNLMFEGRSMGESQLVKEEFEHKTGSKIIMQTAGDFRSRGRGRGTGTGTGTGTNGSRNEWNTRGTPWKSTVGGLSSISEMPREAEMKSESWNSANKENYSFNRDPIPTRDTFRTESAIYNRDSISNSTYNRDPISSSTYNRDPISNSTYNRDPMNTTAYTRDAISNQPYNRDPINNTTFNRELPNNTFFNTGMQGNPFASTSSMNPFATGSNIANPFNIQSIPSTQTPQNFTNPSNMPISNLNTHNYPQFPMSTQGPSHLSQNFSPAGGFNFMQAGYNSQPLSNTLQSSHYYPNPQAIYPQSTQFPSSFHHQYPFPQPPQFTFFQHPAIVESQKPSTLLSHNDQNLINFHGINSLPFAIKSPNPATLKSSFYPLQNDEPQVKKTKINKGEGTQTAVVAEEIVIPGLCLPIPEKLLAEIRKLKPENESYAKLYETMEYSDIFLRVKDSDLRAHKAVLYSSSIFFREQLDKNRGITTLQSSKLVLPSWFSLDAFKIVLKFMYTASLHKETIPIKLAQEMLIIADYLQINSLCDILIIQFILTQITKEDVLHILKLAVVREKELTEGWEYLIDCCLHYIGQNSNTIVRNYRSDCLSLPMQCILRIVNSSMKYLASLEHASLVIKLLTDCHYAQCIFELTQKITNLFLFGYNGHCVDIQRVDFTRPLTKEQVGKLNGEITMEYPLLEEKAPQYLTTCRNTQIPAKKQPDSINQVYSYGKSLPILPKKDLQARGKNQFSFTINDLFRPKNVMSKCFNTESHSWSILIQTSQDGQLSIFLCERGSTKSPDKFISLLYTSVLFEIEIEDDNLKESFRNKNQPEYLAGFYSFPTNHFHMVGERNYCKVSSIGSAESVKISVYVREIGIHSGLLHYLCENFETLMQGKSEKFAELDYFNMKYLLGHDCLPVGNEREAAAALWKYSANKSPECINLLVSEIRFGFLETKDLLIIARDHQGIRHSPVFKFIFEQEYRRRVGNKKNIQRPRKKYEGLVDKVPEDYNNEIIAWILEDQHHQGHLERISELKKKIEEQKKELVKLRTESQSKKSESEIARITRTVSELNFQSKYEPEPRPIENEVFYTPDKNCKIF